MHLLHIPDSLLDQSHSAAAETTVLDNRVDEHMYVSGSKITTCYPSKVLAFFAACAVSVCGLCTNISPFRNANKRLILFRKSCVHLLKFIIPSAIAVLAVLLSQCQRGKTV